MMVQFLSLAKFDTLFLMSKDLQTVKKVKKQREYELVSCP